MNKTNKAFHPIASQSGFTTIEIMVAGTLLMILTSTVYLAYQFSQKHVKGWQQRIHFERTASLCFDRIARDLMLARAFRTENNTLWIESFNKDTVAYTLADSILLRNQFPVNSADILITDMRIQPVSDFTQADPTDVRDEKDREFQLIEILLNFQGADRNLALRTTVRPRNRSEL